MSISRKRIRKIKMGKAEPKNSREWAIFYENLRRVNGNQIRELHNKAAIHNGGTRSGMIVVIPPQK